MDAAYFNAIAKQCREQAIFSTTPRTAESMLRIAEQYERRAAAFEMKDSAP